MFCKQVSGRAAFLTHAVSLQKIRAQSLFWPLRSPTRQGRQPRNLPARAEQREPLSSAEEVARLTWGRGVGGWAAGHVGYNLKTNLQKCGGPLVGEGEQIRASQPDHRLHAQAWGERPTRNETWVITVGVTPKDTHSGVQAWRSHVIFGDPFKILPSHRLISEGVLSWGKYLFPSVRLKIKT